MLRPNTITRILNTLNNAGFLVNFITAEISLKNRHISEVEIIMALSDKDASAINFVWTSAGYRLVKC